MGNVAGKLSPCLCTANTAGDISRRHDIAVILKNPLSDEGLGHSFCYVKPDNNNNNSCLMKSKSLPFDHNNNNNNSNLTTTNSMSSTTTTNNNNSSSFFSTISGASISANASTALSTTLLLDSTYPFTMESASSFSSSPYFVSVPLQPIPRNGLINSGPLPTVRRSGSSSGSNMGSGPIERGFLSGPIERGFISGPLVDPRAKGKFTKLDKIKAKYKLNKWGSIKGIKDSILTAIWGDRNGKPFDYNHHYVIDRSVGRNSGSTVNYSVQFSGFCVENGNESNENVEGLEYENVQWAQGKAGEDRVHIVVSEDHGWVFVGIYDGFYGPDAPDFLMSNLYSAVHKELKSELELETRGTSNESTISKDSSFDGDNNSCCSDQERKVKDSNVVVRCDRQVLELDEKVREKLNQMGMNWSRKTKHSDVLKALSEALRKTEEAYLDIADKMVKENPELSLMGSCVLAMLMIGEDVYLLNVGDSRAVLGRKSTVSSDVHAAFDDFPSLTPLQLTVDHNTYVKEEVQRIRKEHPDDPSAVVNDRVKGSLKVTRAFGAGFLKQPKWNDALLEMFRIEYVGSSPYLTCSPSLIHHKLSPRDKFIILSSDGLYDQYFTNEEAVSEVELFIASTPEGDPAQHLIEQVLFRAAKKSGIDFYELLEIPQGERRRYHDDVSVIVISLEGRIWRSSV